MGNLQPLSRRATLLLQYHARFMRRVPQPVHFDMGNWIEHEGASELPEPSVHGRALEHAGPEVLNDCGMTACAGGWATACPAFQRLGLHLRVEPVSRWVGGGTLRTFYVVEPAYGAARDGWEAVRAFFDVTEAVMEELFASALDDLRTPAEWAARAEEVVAAHGAPLTVLDRLQLRCGFLPRLA